jgi:hypothetical protein
MRSSDHLQPESLATSDAWAATLLGDIASTLDLSRIELARLFGVRRQTIDGWTRRGIPSTRQAKAASVAGLCDLLRHYLRAERIPGVARTPAPAYGGLSMLELIEQDRHNELREIARRSFEWNQA